MRNAGVWALSFVLGVTGLFLAEGQQSPTQDCLTVRPGAGDWVCVNGGWLPVGHPGIPASTPPPTPPPPATGASETCLTVRPGAGDWVCVNGGWLPLGHPDIPASTPPPSPPPPPPPAPLLALPNACATPDPFLGLRSGRFTFNLFGLCVDGGWVPVGHPLASEYLARPLPIDYSGSYTLSVLTGDCGVAIPEVVKRRIYTAHVVPSGARLNVSLTGADFLPGSNSFSGLVVSASEIRFDIFGGTDFYYGSFFDVAENVAGVGTIFVVGVPIIAATDISGARINGAFSQNDGFMGLAVPTAFPGFMDTVWQCPISRFELVRQ